MQVILVFLWITKNCLKSFEFVSNIVFSVFKNFSKHFPEYTRMKNPSYKNKNIERKYLNDMWKNQIILKIMNCLLELGKGFTELKDRELKDRKVKIKR